MKDLITAVKLVTDTAINLHGHVEQQTHIRINKNKLYQLIDVLGNKGLLVHLTLISNWDNEDGLPSVKEIADFTKLSHKDVEAILSYLLNLTIEGTPFYDYLKIEEKNKQNHEIYQVLKKRTKH